MTSGQTRQEQEALDQAARWMARLVAGGHAVPDQLALQAWLDESHEHLDAWRRARRVWSALADAARWLPEAAEDFRPGRDRLAARPRLVREQAG